jgi:hypothetical protein
LLLAFVSGAVIGINFHREQSWGGYGSFRRRLARLGHVSLAALGFANVLFALSPLPRTPITTAAAAAWMAGAALMPAVCFLSAWRQPYRGLFFVPVATLFAAVILTLIGGLL